MERFGVGWVGLTYHCNGHYAGIGDIYCADHVGAVGFGFDEDFEICDVESF